MKCLKYSVFIAMSVLVQSEAMALTVEEYEYRYRRYSCNAIEIQLKDIKNKWQLSNSLQRKELRSQWVALKRLKKVCR